MADAAADATHADTMRADATRADTGLRTLRSAAFAAVCVAVSASGHALVSGAGLPWVSLAAGWFVTLLLVMPLAGRERSRTGITATLLCGQMVLHALFSLGQCRADPVAVQGVHAHGTTVSLMPDPVMFTVHLSAAFVFGWVLHRGERAIWRTVRTALRGAGALTGLLAVVLARPALPAPEPRIRMPRHSGDHAPRRGIVLLGHAVVRRGPPPAPEAA
ncbi:hypothetical protein [Actinomadura sp. 7K507]|uniref:hypothetical protein n=1 Tax=Actinomadura sp. 7K507 TaxID=2530365 RepID=UPI0010445391|nr:hypothetical protein [Actinomadura sp. 7K507]TDC85250.1 hypothetical protein E1285_25360 [Actinomadura sp. 7K507]